MADYHELFKSLVSRGKFYAIPSAEIHIQSIFGGAFLEMEGRVSIAIEDLTEDELKLMGIEKESS